MGSAASEADERQDDEGQATGLAARRPTTAPGTCLIRRKHAAAGALVTVGEVAIVTVLSLVDDPVAAGQGQLTADRTIVSPVRDQVCAADRGNRRFGGAAGR